MAAADLSVGLTGALQGKSISYTITLTNTGPNDAANVQLVDDVPPATTFSDITAPSDVQCVTPAPGEGGTITCTLPSLASGESRTIKVAVGTKGSVANTVKATTTTIDPVTTNNLAIVSTKVTRK